MLMSSVFEYLRKIAWELESKYDGFVRLHLTWMLAHHFMFDWWVYYVLCKSFNGLFHFSMVSCTIDERRTSLNKWNHSIHNFQLKVMPFNFSIKSFFRIQFRNTIFTQYTFVKLHSLSLIVIPYWRVSACTVFS